MLCDYLVTSYILQGSTILLTVVTQIRKDLLLHLKAFDITSMIIGVLICYREMQRSYSITDTPA